MISLKGINKEYTQGIKAVDNLNLIGANDFKLVSALVIALFLTLPQLKLKAKRKDV